MSKKIDIVILAAGMGTRMKTSVPKALVPLLDIPMIHVVLKRVKEFAHSRDLSPSVSAVLGHRKEEIEQSLELAKEKLSIPIDTCLQEKPLGTADALRSYFDSVRNELSDYTMVLCCDTPLLDADELSSLYDEICQKDLDAIVASFETSDPTGYGRILKASKGLRIIEEKEASEEQKKITEVNSGLYIFKTSMISSYINKVSNNNNSGEFYLTDVFEEGANVESLNFGETPNFFGVNDLKQLEEVEHILRARKIEQLRDNGVRFIDSFSVYISEDSEIGSGSIVYPGVILEGVNKIGENTVLEKGVHLKNSSIEEGTKILSYSVLENAIIKKKCQIGPFARLRPGTVINDGSKIGNFVEIKKSVLEKEVKVSHLSYVGDAEIGENTNIGCGFITCNYDGKNKHKTIIGRDSFIGSDTQMVAPINVGERCFVASGSTINKDMPDDSFAISRSKQLTKEGGAKRFLK